MSSVYCFLPDRACIEVRGRDATAFLHGQLSRSVDTLGVEHAPLAAWLDARGRVRALFRVLRLPDSWLLMTERDVLAQVVQKLRMFVLRAAVTITPVDEWRAAALVDPDDRWRPAGAGSAVPGGAVVTRPDSPHWLRIGRGLWHAVGQADAIEGLEPALERAPASAADLAEIRLGIPAITMPVTERYVPQMLNLDRLDALSFDKGCYPGQEVVARVQNLGSVKRRMRRYVGSASVVPSAATEIRTADGPPAGEIVRAAPAAHGFEALAVVDGAAAGSQLTVGGAALREEPLP